MISPNKSSVLKEKSDPFKIYKKQIALKNRQTGDRETQGPLVTGRSGTNSVTFEQSDMGVKKEVTCLNVPKMKFSEAIPHCSPSAL